MSGPLRCERMVHGGLCIAHDDSGATFMIDAAIPGELVDAEIRYRKRQTTFATARHIIEADADRVAPPCSYVPECGGCQLQHIAYPRQLALKREILIDALTRQRVPMPSDVPVHGMPEPWRYRRRGEFHVVRSDRGGVELGFNRARSWRPIAIADCLIHAGTITDFLPVLRELAAHGAQPGTPPLDTLHVTAGDGGELLVRGKPRPALGVRAVDEIATAPGSELRVSLDATTMCWRDHTYRVTPDSFIQANWAQMDVLYECALRALGDVSGLRVVDAYAGIGVLSVHLASGGTDVVCIESNRAAARMGVLNARLNDVAARVRYVAEPVERVLPQVGAGAGAVIVDPPRAGCHSAVTAWLALAGPDRVVYVSCDPATLARDLHVLVASGPYEITALDVVDMFPQTHHVETAVGLHRRVS